MSGKYQLTGYATTEELGRVTLAGARRWLERHGWTELPSGAFLGVWYGAPPELVGGVNGIEVFVSAGAGVLDHGRRTVEMLNTAGRAMNRQPWEVLAEMQAVVAENATSGASA